MQQNDDMEVDDVDNDWPTWNPTVFAVDNGQAVPQHPANQIIWIWSFLDLLCAS